MEVPNQKSVYMRGRLWQGLVMDGNTVLVADFGGYIAHFELHTIT